MSGYKNSYMCNCNGSWMVRDCVHHVVELLELCLHPIQVILRPRDLVCGGM